VVVLGAGVAKSLFGVQDPIGQTVKISVAGRTGINFRVTGVMEAKGGGGMSNQDDQVFIPITTMQQRLGGQRTASGLRNVSVVNVQVADEKSRNLAVARIGDLLRTRHRVVQDDFTVLSQADFIQIAGQILGIMTLLLGAIAGISLVVGGIGIMNIMLVSVTERTREIGIRKAVGASRGDLLSQFLSEAVALSLFGGVLGVLAGIGIALLIRVATPLPADIQPWSVLISLGVASAVGLFFGVYPATRAARLDPIVALRQE
jgi:putative ABC transport system permease protein